jgi:hypothetical protein
MILVNILLMTMMAMVVTETFCYLIPALIKEFKNMED